MQEFDASFQIAVPCLVLSLRRLSVAPWPTMLEAVPSRDIMPLEALGCEERALRHHLQSSVCVSFGLPLNKIAMMLPQGAGHADSAWDAPRGSGGRRVTP